MKLPSIYQIKQAVHDAGYQCRHDMLGYYICTDDEGEYEDEGHPSVGFDGRPHYPTLTEAYRKAFRLHVTEMLA